MRNKDSLENNRGSLVGTPRVISTEIDGQTLNLVQAPKGQRLRMLAMARSRGTEVGAQVAYDVEGNTIRIRGYDMPKRDEIICYKSDPLSTFRDQFYDDGTRQGVSDTDPYSEAEIKRRIKADHDIIKDIDFQRSFGLPNPLETELSEEDWELVVRRIKNAKQHNGPGVTGEVNRREGTRAHVHPITFGKLYGGKRSFDPKDFGEEIGVLNERNKSALWDSYYSKGPSLGDRTSLARYGERIRVGNENIQLSVIEYIGGTTYLIRNPRTGTEKVLPVRDEQIFEEGGVSSAAA